MASKQGPVLDSLARGLLGGLIAGFVKDIPDFILHTLLRLKALSFWDYIGVMAFNRLPRTFADHLTAFAFEVMFSTGLGVVFAYLADRFFQTRHYFLLGAFFGSTVWVVITGGIKLFNISELKTTGLLEPFLTYFLSLLYGSLLMYLTYRFDRKSG